MNNCKFYYEVQKAMKPETKRTVIIHRHIFKNAGTTFDWILKNNFGESFCDHRNDEPMSKEGEKYLLQYLTEQPEIKALSSHHIWFNVQSRGKLNLIPVMFLRHPIERIRSVYNFERQQQSDTPGATMAKKLDFKDYVAWRMKEEVSPVIRNFQTRYLAGIKAEKPIKQKHLKGALCEVGKQKFVGVVDLFDESLRQFGKSFESLGMKLDLSYHPLNVFQTFVNADYEMRARKVLEDLDEVAEIALKKNEFDVLLYKTARDRIFNAK